LIGIEKLGASETVGGWECGVKCIINKVYHYFLAFRIVCGVSLDKMLRYYSENL
jgi:hypothetical protein